jgi:hypothetical protein
VPEVVLRGMDRSRYPDRIIALTGFEKQLARRMLANLHSQRLGIARASPRNPWTPLSLPTAEPIAPPRYSTARHCVGCRR